MPGPFIGVDPDGVQSWLTSLNSAHEDVITSLNKYRTVAQQNNDVAKGAHFASLNSQCEDITNKHLTDHNQLHGDYTKASNDLVNAIRQVAGG